MKIGIVGAGGVGGYFGALLARAGHEVRILARGAHLDAIKSGGLKLEGPRGPVTARVDAAGTPAILAGSDVILFTVKSYDSERAAHSIRDVASPASMVITLQNGVDSAERLAAVLPRSAIVSGAAFVSAVIAEPGVIRYTSAMSSIVIGESDGGMTSRCLSFRDACGVAGIVCEVSTDIAAALWKKFLALATNAALTGVTRQPAGVLYHEPQFRKIAERSIAEIAAVAAAHGVKLSPDAGDNALALLESFPPDMYASLYHDLVRQRPIENDALSGVVTRLAAKYGIDVPIHQFAYACLKPYERGTSAG